MSFKHIPFFSLLSSIGITLLFFLGKIFYIGGNTPSSLFDLSYLSGTYDPLFFKDPFIYPSLLVPAGLLLVFAASVLSVCQNFPALNLNLAGSLCFLSYPVAAYRLAGHYPVKPDLITGYIHHCPVGIFLCGIILSVVLFAGYACIFRKNAGSPSSVANTASSGR